MCRRKLHKYTHVTQQTSLEKYLYIIYIYIYILWMILLNIVLMCKFFFSFLEHWTGQQDLCLLLRFRYLLQERHFLGGWRWRTNNHTFLNCWFISSSSSSSSSLLLLFDSSYCLLHSTKGQTFLPKKKKVQACDLQSLISFAPPLLFSAHLFNWVLAISPIFFWV